MSNQLQLYLQRHADVLPPLDTEGTDVFFFRVKAKPYHDPALGEIAANKDDLAEVIRMHKGVFNDVALFDGREHSYIELGGWTGDQHTALELIGLGAELGLWVALTPNEIRGKVSDEALQDLAGKGMVSACPTERAKAIRMFLNLFSAGDLKNAGIA